MKNILKNKTQDLQSKKLDWNEIQLEMKEKLWKRGANLY